MPSTALHNQLDTNTNVSVRGEYDFYFLEQICSRMLCKIAQVLHIIGTRLFRDAPHESLSTDFLPSQGVHRGLRSVT